MLFLESKLGPKGKKALTYMKKMISESQWKENEPIPKLTTLATKLNISPVTIKKAINVLEHNKILQNYDTLGFFVMSNRLTQKIRRNRSLELIQKSSILINTAKNIHQKKCIIGHYGISYNKSTDIIVIENIINYKVIKCSFSELNEIIINQITIRQLLSLNDTIEIEKQKIKYKRQVELSKFAKLINLNKEKLGIKNE